MKSHKKTITFEPRSGSERKQRILAVAYVTQQVGGWRSGNVTADVTAHLIKEGYPVHEDVTTHGKGTDVNVSNRFNEAMVWLTEQGYAARVVKGRRTTEFVMDPDVNVPIPDYVKGKQFRGEVSQNGSATADPAYDRELKRFHDNRKPAPPLPSSLRGPDLSGLNNLIKVWWNTDREAAETWVASVCQDLERGL